MYKALDPFLRVPTWHTSHPLDEERFHKALDKIVRNPDFEPDRMGDYIRKFVGQNAQHFDEAIDELVRQAEIIRSFHDNTK